MKYMIIFIYTGNKPRIYYSRYWFRKGYIEYKAIIKVNNKYYSFDYYQSPYWNFEDTVDKDIDLIEVFPKEVTTVIYV